MNRITNKGAKDWIISALFIDKLSGIVFTYFTLDELLTFHKMTM